MDPLSCTDAIAQGIAERVTEPVTQAVSTALNGSLATILFGLTQQLHAGIEFMSITLAGWLLVPSTRVCPTGFSGWLETCATGDSPAAQVRGWLLPVTALVAVLGIVWQGITMVVSRKGEPLLTVLKGLFSTALWGVVGIAGTQLALLAGDSYSFWVLQQAIFGDSADPVQSVGTAIASMSADESFAATLVLILLQIPFVIATIIQIILMIFREGAVVILAGQLQLAAAGGFTRLTSGWLPRVAGWVLAFIAYKPIAATIYAVAFALFGDGLRNILMGLAVMVMAVIAMPALMRFFNWTVGTIASNGNGLGVFGTTMAASLQGASLLRGSGGGGAADHARFLDSFGPGGGSGGSGGGGGGSVGAFGGGPSFPPSPAGSGGSGAAGSAASGGGSGAAGGGAAAGGVAAGDAAAAGAATGGVAAAAMVVTSTVDSAKQRIHGAGDAAGGAMSGDGR